MYRLLLVALIALSGCMWRHGMRDGGHGDPRERTAVIVTGGTVIITGPLITIDEGGTLCGPESADPQHTCP